MQTQRPRVVSTEHLEVCFLQMCSKSFLFIDDFATQIAMPFCLDLVGLKLVTGPITPLTLWCLYRFDDFFAGFDECDNDICELMSWLICLGNWRYGEVLMVMTLHFIPNGLMCNTCAELQYLRSIGVFVLEVSFEECSP